MVIERASVRDQVHQALLRKLLDGELAIGQNIDEPALAAELGVSRTPIREALARMVEQGLVDHRQNRGYFVTPVTVLDAREIYPMLAALEALALRTADPTDITAALPDLASSADLTAAGARGPREAHAADDRFHDQLVALAGNTRLTHTITSLKRFVHRFEHAFMTDTEALATSSRQHQAIVDALRTGDIDAAARALDDNWRHGMNRFLGHLTASSTNT
jgi:DNA-binding GntR family transcriptional regulator